MKANPIITALITATFICLETFASEQLQIQVIASDQQPLPGIVVYLLPEEGQSLPWEENEVVIGQSNKKFSPYVEVMSTRDLLTFNNDDDISHHVYSVLSKSFAYRLRKNERISHGKLSNTGETLMACNIHDWMSGYIYVVDTPIHGKTNTEGQVTLSAAESGRYSLRLWHPQMHPADKQRPQAITLPIDSTATIELQYAMDKIPSQESFDSFEALEEY